MAETSSLNCPQEESRLLSLRRLGSSRYQPPLTGGLAKAGVCRYDVMRVRVERVQVTHDQCQGVSLLGSALESTEAGEAMKQ